MCSSVILFEGQFLAAVGSGMGALNTLVCMGIGPSGSQRAAGREVACQVACVEMVSREGMKVRL